ncbi:MAG: PfkB family carbohydrate kinase [Sumerlaeia bacterium]
MLTLTFTLNPSVDLWVSVPKIRFDAVLRSPDERRFAGGKGINASRLLHAIGSPTVACALCDRDFAQLASREDLPLFHTDPGVATRINIHAREEESGRLLKINTPGAPVSVAKFREFLAKLPGFRGQDVALILAGSLPPGLPDYAWTGIVRAQPWQPAVFLDVAGEPLRLTLEKSPPTVLKINRAEAQELLPWTIGSGFAGLEDAAKEFLTKGCEAVCLTDARHGALLVQKDGQVWSCAPSRTVDRDVVGAGDSFLAGMADAWNRGERGGELLAFATACATARAIAPDDAFVRPQDIGEALRDVKPRRLH